ncbi:DUF6572 domain-containing protein [Isosphaeraceae bacterium EP7]
MSLQNQNIVDAIGVEISTESVVLTIADSWDWIDVHAHLSALQAKLNFYFEFIESGQIWDVYPSAKGRQLVIDVVARFPMPTSGRKLLEIASEVASQLEVIIRFSIYEMNPGSEL